MVTCFFKFKALSFPVVQTKANFTEYDAEDENVIFFSLFALLFFMSKYAWDYYRNHLRIKYICPLGEDKFEVDKLKFMEKNISLLNFIETTKEQLLAENTKKIAEDEEYEYYIEEEK